MDAFSVTSLTSTCQSLSSRAVAAASEIDALVGGGGNSAATKEQSAVFEQLAALSTKLQQFRQHVEQLQQCLQTAAMLSVELRTRLPAILPECDGAMAIITKQLMRLSSDTPGEKINARAISQYEASLEALTSMLIYVTPILSV
jgi:predicted  nucleic acid-binding Zn-ribbon protein